MSFEKPTSQADDDYFRVTSCSAKRGGKDVEGDENPGLNVDTPNVAKARRMVKSRPRTGKSEMNSVCRADNAVSKSRKRKAKLRSSVSKSTVTTKDTGFIGRKETKRRRHRGGGSNLRTIRFCIHILRLYHATIRDRSLLFNDNFCNAGLGVTHQPSNPREQVKKSNDVVIHQPSNSPEHVKKSNDVVEIFHNISLKNSNSKMSSKHSKVDRAKNEKKSHLPATEEDPRRMQKASALTPRDRCLEHVNRECQSHDKKNEQNRLQTSNYQSNSK